MEQQPAGAAGAGERKMSATQVVAGPDSDIGRLLQELAADPNVQLRVDSGDGLFIAWLSGKEIARSGCHADQWWSVGAEGWNLMALFGAVQRVRFVREPDAHRPEREALSIRLAGGNGAATLSVSFTPLYDDQDRPLAGTFARWEELRARYGGRDEIRAENGTLIS
jgi:hypothetical protein